MNLSELLDGLTDQQALELMKWCDPFTRQWLKDECPEFYNRAVSLVVEDMTQRVKRHFPAPVIG